GAQVNAFTSKQQTCYHFVSIDENAEYCAEILSDLFFNSTFPDEELKKERSVIIEEINQSLDTPEDVCMDTLSKVFFDGHPLSRQILGTKESVAAITSKDLADYRDRRYTADNCIVSVAGHISEEAARELVKKYFLKSFKNLKAEKSEYKKASYNKGEIITERDIEQAHIGMAFPGLRFSDALSPALMVLNAAFGSGMSSRLFQRVREELGLAYTIYTYPSFYKNEGAFVIYTGTNPAYKAKALDAIRGEIEILKKSGLTEQEVKSAKQQVKAAYVFGEESTASLMRIHSKYVLMTEKPFDIDAQLKRIDAVEMSQLNELIEKIFDYEKMALSLVVNKKRAKKAQG
ncbi:MAG TPA: pitrilysin family protein, partial [Eubacteriales bacterium]|nr:pitrilysin family protein [Eubacteriales bacterium]